MIRRIVKLTFHKEHIIAFKAIFEGGKDTIAAFNGCYQVELLQDANNPCVFFTHSYWRDEAALNEYRQSDFFKATWQKTKALFADKPAAWSTVLIDKNSTIHH